LHRLREGIGSSSLSDSAAGTPLEPWTCLSVRPVRLSAGVLAPDCGAGSEGEHPIDFRPDGKYFLDADAELLKTVFLSLLANAGKYADPGSTVDVRLARAGKRLEVTIGNACAAGPGLAPDLLLQRGTRGVNSAGTEGSGMGLHLMKRLVGDLGGDAALRVDLPGRFEVTVALDRRSREDGA